MTEVLKKMAKEVRNFNRRYAKEYNIFRTIFYMSFLYIVVFGFFNIFYNYKIEGRKNIPPKKAKSGKYIYAANHVSIFDPTMVAMAALCPIAFMAKKELFEPTEKLSWLVKRLGAFAVDRTKPEIATFKTVRDIVSTSWSLGIFPQGGIRRNHTIEKINKGFAVIAKAAKWDILPVSIVGCEQYNWIPFKSKVIIQIGKPISCELPQDEIIEQWGKQVASMCHYQYIETESENSEVQDQQEFAQA